MNAGIWTGGTFSGTSAKVRTEIRKDRDRDKGHTKKQAQGRKALTVGRARGRTGVYTRTGEMVR